MADRAGVLNRRARQRAFAVMAALTVTVPLVAGPAQAQFFWDHGGRLSADDAARVAIERGFRVLARPVRNDDVYLVEVLDRRGARERLIITADSGEIVRRLFVEAGPRYRRDQDVETRRAPDDDHRPGFFARLFGGDDPPDGEARPDQTDRPDRDGDDPDEAPRPAHLHRYPRVVEQNRDSFRESPIESAPLAPPSAVSPVIPRAPRVHPPVQASLPPAPAVVPKSPPAAPVAVTPPASDHPMRSISSNPLAIPGSREQDEKVGGKAAQQTPPARSPEAAKPAAAVKPKDPVAVAPLD